ncbi:MAG: DNA polymerase III subunit delta [Tannerellaceae bacterium]|jgi:DNA polymerase-3 subunit delta'|nr:DNA polymerase III subunit delta [Tannerellaceae bacterium]
MYFNDVIGQDRLKRRLIVAARRRIVPHAQLFSEKNGSGAFPLALAYARYLNCREPSDDDSCGRCPSCLKYDELAHPDLHFVFPIVKKGRKTVCDDYLPQWRELLKRNAYFSLEQWLGCMETGNSQAQIYAEESKQVLGKMNMRIYEAEYRVLLVWLPEKMNETCANKLLKIIEEPPPQTVILMVSEDPLMLLETIRSRVQPVNVNPVDNGSMVDALVRRECLEREAAVDVARLAGGSYIKALETISLNEENAFFLEHFKEMMRNSWARNIKAMKTSADHMASLDREQQKRFLTYCQYLVRENFVHRFQAPELNYMSRREAEFAIRFAPFVNERNVFDLMGELSKAELHTTRNVNAKMVFFDLSLRITALLRR